MKKVSIVLLLALALALWAVPGGAVAAEIVDSGTCGEDEGYLTWTLDSDGLLTISGWGVMADYCYDDDLAHDPWNCWRSSITSVVIGNGVTRIGRYVFAWCSSLTSLTIPDSVTSIGEYAVYGCDNLTNVTIGNGVTHIGDYAFACCNNLTSVTIPDSVTSIGSSAFWRCYSLTSVTIGDGVTSIGSSAFSDCDSLTSVTIGNGVTSIGEGVFSECSGLTSVIIPDSVTSIRDGAFEGCSGLNEVTIPGSVTSIGSNAFSGCNNIKTVFYGGSKQISSYFSDDVNIIPYKISKQLALISQPVDSTIVVGEKIKLSVEATGCGNTYQWYYKKPDAESFVPSTISSGTKATYSMTMAAKYDGWQYYCVVTDYYGNSVQSDTVTVYKYRTPLEITTQPVDYSGKIGSVVRFTTAAQGDGLTYQWYFKRAGETAFNESTVSAAQKAAFTMTMAAKYDGWQYYCIVTDEYCNTVQTDTVTIHNIPTPLKIVVQPASYAGDTGNTVVFRVSAQGDGLTYQWYYSSNGGTTWKTSPASGNKTTQLSVPVTAGRNGYRYHCVVTDLYGDSVTSNAAVLTAYTPLAITTQPVDFTGAVGSTIRFTVKATGDDLTYQWYYKKPSSSSFVKSTLAAGTNSVFTMTMADKYNGWQYYCVVTDAHGRTVSSNTVKINCVQMPLRIMTQPEDFLGKAGSTIKFTVAAQGGGLTYQWWYKKTDAASFVKSTLAAGTKATFTMTMAEKYDGWQYYCIITDAYGQTAQTNTVTIHLSRPLQIVSLPQDFTGAVGSTIKFTVNATGDDLTYQWWYKKTGASSFVKSTLASGTKATFTMKMAEKYDGWQYYCVVKDANGNSLRTNTVTIHLK